jgi:predicted nicotinamide N-methyase
VLDQPCLVAGRRVLDFAAGCGIAAIACAKAGAASVEAVEIDPLAIAAIGLNASENGVIVQAVLGDIVGTACRWDVVLCGDICYEAPMSDHVMPWLRALAASADVWLADPDRAYLPRVGLRRRQAFDVPTTLELEDRTHRTVTLFQLLTD